MTSSPTKNPKRILQEYPTFSEDGVIIAPVAMRPSK